MKKSKPLVEEAQAYRYALWLLTRRPHSSGELLEKFKRRTLPPELCEKVLARLRVKKYVDDGIFSETFTHSRMTRGWGPGKIKAGLLQKKIPREMAQKALEALFPEEKASQKARELLERQKRRFLRKKEKEKGQRIRLAYEFLRRKGYSYPAARLAVKDVFGYNPDLPEEGN